MDRDYLKEGFYCHPYRSFNSFARTILRKIRSNYENSIPNPFHFFCSFFLLTITRAAVKQTYAGAWYRFENYSDTVISSTSNGFARVAFNAAGMIISLFSCQFLLLRAHIFISVSSSIFRKLIFLLHVRTYCTNGQQRLSGNSRTFLRIHSKNATQPEALCNPHSTTSNVIIYFCG